MRDTRSAFVPVTAAVSVAIDVKTILRCGRPSKNGLEAMLTVYALIIADAASVGEAWSVQD